MINLLTWIIVAAVPGCASISIRPNRCQGLIADIIVGGDLLSPLFNPGTINRGHFS